MTRRSCTARSFRMRIQPMMKAMSLAKLGQAVLHAMAAFLLCVSLAAPAMAEIGCAQENSIHLEDNQGAGGIVGASDRQSQPEDDTGTPQGQCAFSHGHCAGIAVLSAATARRVILPPAYDLWTAKPLRTGAVETPHHPPNA